MGVKSGVKNALVCLNSTILLGTTIVIPSLPGNSKFSGIVAKAEESTNTEESDNSSSSSTGEGDSTDTGDEKASEVDADAQVLTDENVYNKISSNAEAITRVKKSIAYNETLQYIMTYSILSDDFGSDGSYAEIYNGKLGADGVSKNFDDAKKNIVTGTEVALNGVQKTADNDIDQEKLDKEAETKKSSNSKDEDAEKAVKKQLMTAILESYRTVYGTKWSEPSLFKATAGSTLDDWFSTFEGGDESVYFAMTDYVANVGQSIKDIFTKFDFGWNNDNYIIVQPKVKSVGSDYGSASVQKGIISGESAGGNDLPKEAYSKLNASVGSIVKGIMTSENPDKEINSTLLKTVGKKIESGMAEYKGTKDGEYVDLYKPITNYKPNGEMYRARIGKDSKKSKAFYKKIQEIQTMYPYKSDTNGYDTGEQVKEETKVLQEKFSKIKESEEYKAYRKSIKNSISEGEASAKDIHTLGWMPLYTHITAESLQEDKKYKELIKAYDKGNLVKTGEVNRDGTNTSNDTSEARRALRLNDIMYYEAPTSSLDSKKLRQSASPYYVYNYDDLKNSYGGATIGNGSVTLKNKANGTTAIGLYAGMRLKEDNMKDADLSSTKKFIKSVEGGKGTPQPFKATTIEANSKYDKKYTTQLIAIRNTNSGKMSGMSNDAEYTLGIDNYGNIITGNTLKVVIPYWQNTAVKEFKDYGNFLASPIVLSLVGMSDDADSTAKKIAKKVKPAEKAKPKGIKFTDKEGSYANTLTNGDKTVKATVSSDLKEYKHALKSQGDDSVKLRQAVALSIVSQTKGDVKAFNDRFTKASSDQKELYMTTSMSGQKTNSSEETKENAESLEGFTEADLLKKLGMILETGAYEFIRLTVASFIISFYTGDVKNFTLGNVFYTTPITEMGEWAEVLQILGQILIAVMGVYILIMGYRLFRNEMKFTQFAKQFVMLTLVLAIPQLLYAPLINTTLNKPPEKILGNQLEQISIMDTYLKVEGDKRETDEMYSAFYGGVEDLRDRQNDYVVKLYTNTHVDGFKIDDFNLEDVKDLKKNQALNSKETGDWNKKDLVAVNVSIFDLFEWVSNKEIEEDLFTWLASKKGDKYKDLSDYTEYKVNAGTEYQDLGINGADAQITASDLYKIMYQSLEEHDVQTRINNLFKVTKVFRNRDNTDEDAKVTNKQKDNFIRDLSFSQKSREIAYGDASRLSADSEEIWSKYVGTDPIPTEDYFAFSSLFKDGSLQARHSLYQETLESKIYDATRKVLDEYITNYSLVREIVGESKPNFKKAEFRVVTMNMWFALNDELNYDLFPKSYQTDSLSFDSYMRLLFIPMDAYADLEASGDGLDNVSIYIGLRDHAFTLMIFLVALIALMAFGLTYLAIFSGVLMVVMLWAYIKNYIWKQNYANKSWLGTLVIVFTFAIAKIGLLVLWYFLSYLRNYLKVVNDGDVYPATLIHSLLLAVYIFICFKYLFAKVLRAVIADKENLGGQIFSDKGKEMIGKVQGMFGGNPGVGNSYGRPGDSLRGDGNDSGTGDSKLKTAAGLAGVMLDKTKGNLAGNSNNADSVDSIEDAITNGSKDDESGASVGSRLSNLSKGTAEAGAMNKLGKDLDGIETAPLSNLKNIDAMNNAEMGGLLGTNENGEDVGIIKGIGTPSAKVAQEALKEDGIESYVKDNGNGTSDIYFNATGLNEKDGRVRKALWGSTVSSLITKAEKGLENSVTGGIEDVKTTGSQGMLDTQLDEKGIYTVPVADSKQSVAPQYVDKLIAEAKEQGFEVVSVPKRNKFSKSGGYTNGELKFVAKDPISSNGETLSTSYAKVLTGEGGTKLRDEYLGDKITDKYDKVASIKNVDQLQEGSSEGIVNYRKGVAELKERGLLTEGVSIGILSKGADGNGQVGIKFDSTKVSESQIAEIQKVMGYNLSSGTKESYDRYGEDAKKLGVHIVKGGNNGYITTKVDETRLNKSMKDTLETNAILNSKDTLVSEFKTGESTDSVVTKLNTLTSYGSNENVSKYEEAQNELFRQGEEIMLGKNNDHYSVISKLSKGAREIGLNNSKLDDFETRANTLNHSLKTAKIDSKDYEREIEKLSSEAQMFLQDEGVLGDVYARNNRGEAEKLTQRTGESKEAFKKRKASVTKTVDNYVNARKKLDESGLNAKDVSSILASEGIKGMDTVVENIQGVERASDGSIKVTARKGKGVNNEELTKLVKSVLPKL